MEALQQPHGQGDLRFGRQTQPRRCAQFNHQIRRRRWFRQFDLHKGGRSFGLVPMPPPAAKGGVMDAVLPGEGGSGQTAPFKRRQEFAAPG